MEPKTEADRFILGELQPLLQPGEVVQSAGYLPPFVGGGVTAFARAATAKAAFVALTNQRLILIQTRLGAFKPLLENQGVVSIGHAEIKGVHVGRMVRIELADGKMIEYLNRRGKEVSTQAELLAQLPEKFGISKVAAKGAATQKILAIAAFLAGLAYVVYSLVN